MLPSLIQRNQVHSSSACRWISRQRKRLPRYRRRSNDKVTREKKSGAEDISDKKDTSTIDLPKTTSENLWIERLRQKLQPTRFGSPYTREQVWEMTKRFPLWMILVFLALNEETSPFGFIRIKGPSMLPTMSPDESDIWLQSAWRWRKRLGLSLPYKKGDLVGFANPDFPQYVSCKRVIGVAGDAVPRYGQYVHLFIRQDPEHLGITWPSGQSHSWIDQSCPWDVNCCLKDRLAESRRTLVVPVGHVWVEADCPALGIDSRHFGPIPETWLKGRTVARVWPFWRSGNNNNLSHNTRPHPIPLDAETLAGYNVYRVKIDSDK